MNDILKITALQSDLHWENPEANHQTLGGKMRSATAADAYILPEMFPTGFSMDAKRLSEPMNGPTHQWMKAMANELRAAVGGSVIIEDAGHFYNRFLWVQPGGRTEYYDKRHRFTMAGEHHHFSAGSSHTVVELKGWKIFLQVCYDLRFPVWSRNRSHYDVAVYVANWPEARSAAWSKLLLARAIENQCYVIGVNRVGTDGKDISYSGDSAIIDPRGEYLVCPPAHSDQALYAELSKAELLDFRKKFPVLKDGDEFEVRV
ncbi:MAG: amidohydrolase [Cryomorphaceae bacterium]|nr:MAG: amidohydrolase [Cryomorphaceae bacterium]